MAPKSLTDSSASVELGQGRIRPVVILICCFPVLPSLDAPHVSGNSYLGKPRHPLLPTKRRLPEDSGRQQRLRTDSLRQPHLELTRFSHALLSAVFPLLEVQLFGETGRNPTSPRGEFIVSQPDPASPNSPRRVCSREAGKDLCAVRRPHTRRPTGQAPRSPDCPPPAPTRQAPSSVQAHSAELVSRTSKENPRESLTSLERSPSPRAVMRPSSSFGQHPPKRALARPHQSHSGLPKCRTTCSRPPRLHDSNRAFTVHSSLTYEPASRSKGGGQAGQPHQSSHRLDKRSNTCRTRTNRKRITTALPLTPTV